MSYYFGNGFNPAIVGRVLRSVEVSDEKTTLTLTFDDGSINRYVAYGDCCSETWIEYLTVPSDVNGATITEVPTDYVDGREATEDERAASLAHHDWIEVLTVYQSSIKTDRGEIIVEYRNDSNGYYGGSLNESVAPTEVGAA